MLLPVTELQAMNLINFSSALLSFTYLRDSANCSHPLTYRITRNFGDEKIWRNLPKCYPLNFDELYFCDLQSWSTYDVTLSATCEVSGVARLVVHVKADTVQPGAWSHWKFQAAFEAITFIVTFGAHSTFQT